MAGEAKRLSDRDWEILLPGTPHKIGETDLSIVPLGLESTKKAVGVIRNSFDVLREKGITPANYSDPQNIIEITALVLEQAPEFLVECSGLHLDDIKRLPLGTAVGLVSKVIEANVQSNEDLVKNLTALVATLKTLREEVGGSQTSATS